MDTDIGPHEARWVLSRLDGRPWRDVLAAALADNHPELYARLTDPASAAVVSLLEVGAAERCLDATGGWGQIAVPLAQRAQVVVLAPSAERAAIIQRIAEQEGVALGVAVGMPEGAAFAAAAFDVVLLHDPARGVATAAADAETGPDVVREVARLLRPSGRAYIAVSNPLAALAGAPSAEAPADVSAMFARCGERFAAAGLRPIAAYACFPDHERPRFLVPLPLVAAFVRTMPHAAGAGLAAIDAAAADAGVAGPFAPSFAFIVKREDAAHGSAA